MVAFPHASPFGDGMKSLRPGVGAAGMLEEVADKAPDSRVAHRQVTLSQMRRKVTIDSGVEMFLKESITDQKLLFDESDSIYDSRMRRFDEPERIDRTQ